MLAASLVPLGSSRLDMLHKIPWLGRWKLQFQIQRTEDGTISKKEKKSKEVMASEKKQLPN